MTLRTTATALFPVFAALLPAALAAAQAKPAANAPRSAKQYTIEQFMETEALRDASFSADGERLLFSSNRTGIFNVYSLSVRGGEPTALTASTTDNSYAVACFPQDDRSLYTRDQGGNELNHLFVRTADGKEQDLTPGEKLKAMFMGFSSDAAAFYVASNERDPRFFDVYRYDARSYERKLLYRNDAGYLPVEVSDNGAWLALLKPNTTNDSDIYVWNAGSGETSLISKHEGTARFTAETFDPAGEFLYYTTDAGGEFAALRRYSLRTGLHEDVEKAEWDITHAVFSPGGRYRVSAINVDGRTALRVSDTGSGAAVPLPPLPEGAITGVTFSRDEKRMAFYVNGDRSPANLYVHELGTSAAQALTHALGRGIDASDLAEAEVVRFKSFDGTSVPSIFYKPLAASAAHRAPAIVYVHGGPGGQTTRGYNSQVQYLVNHGYVVLGINNRGSSGYGKAYLAADDRRHGKEPLRDCVEGARYLAGLPYVDSKRIAIMGGSYGGYMVLAALAFEPDAFAAGVDLFGVSNWLRTLASIPAWWEVQRKALYEEIGDPTTQEKMLRAISPLFHADSIRRPLLVLQGANDPRVLKVESDEIVAAVRRNKVPVEYIVFPDEGHGFTKKKNQVEGYGAVLRFLDAQMPAAGEPAN